MRPESGRVDDSAADEASQIINNGGQVMNPIEKNKQLLMTYKKPFKIIFKSELQAYMSPLFGFDIVKFDDYLKTPDGTSTNDFVTKNYGEEGCSLIKKLIGMEG